MKLIDATGILSEWERRGRLLFSSNDLCKVFDEEGERLRSTIRRLVDSRVITRVARDLYLFRNGATSPTHLVESIAVELRRGEYVFESLESAASQWGVISQIPVGRITCMTTGLGGTFQTPFGTIEFVHTAAGPEEILANTVMRDGNPLPIATKRYAVHNLLRCNRSTYLIDWEEVEHDEV